MTNETENNLQQIKPFTQYIIQTLIGCVLAISVYAVDSKVEAINEKQRASASASIRCSKDNASRIKVNEDRIYFIINNLATKDDLKDLRNDIKELLKRNSKTKL